MRIHMLGIGGTGMGSLAGLLTEAGHAVTGTDEALYPPMSDQIAALGITPFQGYRAENVATTDPELVVIGNVIRRDNPEAQEVMRRGLPYRSMPQALAELFLERRTPLVIAGTHGKTTCAAMAAWLLTAAGEEPGFLVGGVGRNLGRSSELGRGPLFVVEGDEYDTAFFDKGPKFLHYRPQVALITSIEFDHADIYRDVEQIQGSFDRFAAILPPDGLLVVNAGSARALAAATRAACRVVTYGMMGDADYCPRDVQRSEAGMRFGLPRADEPFLLPMWGEHNIENATGVLAMLLESGVGAERLAAGLAGFQGVARRQQVLGTIRGITVVDDFAHHPTAVAKTIAAVRQQFPARRLWAIFEPRSNTSRRNIFQQEFTRALATADRAIVAFPHRAEAIPEAERFDAQHVAEALMQGGIDAHAIREVDHIVEFLMRAASEGDVLLLMSNGGFGGLAGKLLEALARRRTSASQSQQSQSGQQGGS